MFFSIATQPDYRFFNRCEHLGLWINFDDGWHVKPGSIIKGPASNHCRLVLTPTGVDIVHSEPRSFPLWFEHGFITNLYAEAGKSAWASDRLHMDPDGRIVWTPIALDLDVPQQMLTVDQAKQHIIELLDLSIKELDQPVKMFCTGGLDTFLIYSLLKYHDQPTDLIQHEHFDDNKFVRLNQPALEHHWSYRRGQLHHWNQPVCLASGGCGDEYFLRGPAVIAMLTAWHDIDFAQRLEQTQYHFHHFQKYQELWQTTWAQRHQLQDQYRSAQQLHAHVLNTLANDHQHWHLGLTTTWTPLKNIEIARTLLQVPMHDLMPQFTDGALTKDIICHYCPEVLQFVSRFKNHNAGENLQAFWQWHHA